MSGNDPGRRNRKLRHLLLNARFQLKYCFMMVGMSSVISIMLGYFLVDQMRENSRMLQLEAELDAAFQAQLADSDAQTVLVMIGALVLFNVALFFIGVFITHRMAGPIYVFRRYLLALSEGRVPQIRKLRKGDEFKELLEALQVACDGIQGRTEADIALLNRAVEALSGQGDADEVRQSLLQNLDQKRAALGERTGDLRA
jgi:hypothetical protein